jgi:hypothetical protein
MHFSWFSISVMVWWIEECMSCIYACNGIDGGWQEWALYEASCWQKRESTTRHWLKRVFVFVGSVLSLLLSPSLPVHIPTTFWSSSNSNVRIFSTTLGNEMVGRFWALNLMSQNYHYFNLWTKLSQNWFKINYFKSIYWVAYLFLDLLMTR